jgi:hypothetical protein
MKKGYLDQYHTHWQWYRDLFSITILRYFVLWFSIIPIVLHVFGTVPEEVQSTFGQAVVMLRPRLPFSWAILWLSSLSYTAALLLFVVRCPDFIKKYHTYADYVAYGHSERWIVYLVRDVYVIRGKSWEKLKNRLIEKKYAVEAVGGHDVKPEISIEADKSLFRFYDESKNYEIGMPLLNANGSVDESRTVTGVREMFWEIFGAHAGSRRTERGFIISLLWISVVLFAVVFLEHIWSAIPYTFAAICDSGYSLFAFLRSAVGE